MRPTHIATIAKHVQCVAEDDAPNKSILINNSMNNSMNKTTTFSAILLMLAGGLTSCKGKKIDIDTFFEDISTWVYVILPVALGIVLLVWRLTREMFFRQRAVDEDTTQTVSIKNKYSIELPSYTKPLSGLARDASLQYGSRRVGFFIYVVDEKKSDVINVVEKRKSEGTLTNQENTFLSNLAEIIIANMFNHTEMEGYSNINVNGLEGISFNIANTTTHLGKNITTNYHFAFFEGQDTIYQICSQIVDGNIEPFLHNMKHIVNSFKEISN